MEGHIDMARELTAEERRVAERVLTLDTSEHHTVREYLAELILQLFLGNASEKYGFTGESDWRYDLYSPLRDAGLIQPWQDGYGLGAEAGQAADRLICLALRAMAAPPKRDEITQLLADYTIWLDINELVASVGDGERTDAELIEAFLAQRS